MVLYSVAEVLALSAMYILFLVHIFSFYISAVFFFLSHFSTILFVEVFCIIYIAVSMDTGGVFRREILPVGSTSYSISCCLFCLKTEMARSQHLPCFVKVARWSRTQKKHYSEEEVGGRYKQMDHSPEWTKAQNLTIFNHINTHL